MKAGPVYVLDLDQTIVGNVTWVNLKYNIAMYAESIGLIADGKALLRPWFVDAIAALIRPHFAEFFAHAKKQGARVFVYTSSETTWATYVIEIVEELIGLTFDRPLFTRANARAVDPSVLVDPKNGSKSMSLIRDAIEKSIGRALVPEHVVIVDDNLGVWDRGDVARYQFVTCPPYAYKAFVDPFDGFYPNVVSHPEIARMLMKANNSTGIAMYNPLGGLQMRYQWCVTTLANITREYEWHKNDEFWLQMRLCGVKGCKARTSLTRTPTRSRAEPPPPPRA